MRPRLPSPSASCIDRDHANAAARPVLMAAARRDWLARLVPVAAVLVTAVLRLLRRTLRPRFVNGDDLYARWARGERVILAFWHDRLVLMPFANTLAQR